MAYAKRGLHLVVVGLIVASCGVSREGQQEPETGGPPVDWNRSPLASVQLPSSPEDVASFEQEAPFAAIDAVDLPAGLVATYTDGTALAFVLSDPTVWIIQSPLDPNGLDGLDAENAAYADAATFGTEVSNIVLSSGVKALRITGGVSTTLLFARDGSLVQISAPRDTAESFLQELASDLSATG